MTQRRSLPVPEGLDGLRLDAAISRLFGLSRTAAADLVGQGMASLDGQVSIKSERVTAGAELVVELPEPDRGDLPVPTVVDGLREARARWRASQQRSKEVGGRELPSREALGAIVCGLRGALFPMRLGPPDLRQESEDFYVGHTLDSVLGALLSFITPFKPAQALAAGFIACVAGSLGHLVMKALKRDRGVTTWGPRGRSVTGANGLLDRVDALCFAAPIFFHSVRWYFGAAA